MRLLPPNFLAASVALLAAACSPTLDWRDVSPQAPTRLQSMFPCKPARQVRRITLAAVPVEMTLQVCDAAGMTFAIARADVADPARVATALDELATATQRNLQATAATLRREPARVPGMTPNARAVALSFAGRNAAGRATHQSALFFANGTTVFQVTVLGENLAADAVETFFGALRFPA